MSSATDYVATDLTVPMHFRLSFEEKIIHLNYFLRNIFTNYLNIIKSFGSTNRLQPLGEVLFMLRMEINVGYGFLLFGFTRVTVRDTNQYIAEVAIYCPSKINIGNQIDLYPWLQ